MRAVLSSQLEPVLLRTENWELRTVFGQKLNEYPIELLRCFLIRQMAYAVERHQASIPEIAAQPLGRSKLHRAVSLSPEQQRRIIANLRKRGPQFRQVRAPILNDPSRVPKRMILKHRQPVPSQGIRRNLRPIGKQAAQPQVIQSAKALDRVAKQ